MHSAECLPLREARSFNLWPAAVAAGIPQLMPVASNGFSGRPRCRIFPLGRLWVLQLEIAGGWLINGPPPRIKFPSLAAAVNHAVLHGYDYRIITPSPVARIRDRGRDTAPLCGSAPNKEH